MFGCGICDILKLDAFRAVYLQFLGEISKGRSVVRRVNETLDRLRFSFLTFLWIVLEQNKLLMLK